MILSKNPELYPYSREDFPDGFVIPSYFPLDNVNLTLQKRRKGNLYEKLAIKLLRKSYDTVQKRNCTHIPARISQTGLSFHRIFPSIRLNFFSLEK